MAVAVAHYLIEKISDALVGALVAEGIDKAKHHIGNQTEIHGQMRDIKLRLDLIQAFILHADEHRNDNRLLAAWVKQMRELAFDIEYLVDLYSYTMAEAKETSTGWLSMTRLAADWWSKGFKRAKKMKPLEQIADELKMCYTRLDNLSKDKLTFGVDISTSSATSNYMKGLIGESRKLAVDAHFIPDEAIFGVNDQKAQLKEWLVNEEETARIEISVWGIGGVGKTTLVTSVYKSQSIVNYFECRAWVSVSQDYNIDDILRKIIKELHRESKLDLLSNLESMDCRALVENLHTLLRQKRYLIILDDVWVPEVWQDLTNKIHGNNIKNRVIITTRSHDVAYVANENHILELKPLEETSATALFNYHVFQKKKFINCPISLKDWANKIVHKCGGLPLALVWMANYLATKEQLEPHWKSAYSMLISSPEKNIIDTILILSITNLPYYLQSCFLYCSIFPEDYAIKRKLLLRLWISKGFIPNEIVGGSKMELAEDYLGQLVSRSMFQVTRRNRYGRAKYLIIHDLVREIILKKQQSESFYEIWDKNIERKDIKSVRCLSIFELDKVDNDDNKSYYTPRLHSLHLFSKSTYGLHVGNFKLLRILNLDWSGIKSLPEEVNILFNLRYLSMRGTKVKNLSNSISRLQNLETLDFWGSYEINKMPDGVSKLNKLQHLMGSNIHGDEMIGIKNLKQLETLKEIIVTNKIVVELGSLLQLRTLHVRVDTTEVDIIKLAASIVNMKYLVSLKIDTPKTQLDLDGGGFIELPRGLHKLELRGNMHNGMLPKCLQSTNNLKSLTLKFSNLKEDPIPIIAASSPNLRYLEFYRCFKEGGAVEKIWFPVGSFPNLTALDM